MDNNYEICSLQICPFKVNNSIYKPDRNNYPYRLCVLDKFNKKAIDVLSGYCYDYIETSLVYFIGNESKKIKEGKRYAIMKLGANYVHFTQSDMNEANNIIKRLMAKFYFPDGNAISNEDYLSMITDYEKIKLKRK